MWVCQLLSSSEKILNDHNYSSGTSGFRNKPLNQVHAVIYIRMCDDFDLCEDCGNNLITGELPHFKGHLIIQLKHPARRNIQSSLTSNMLAHVSLLRTEASNFAHPCLLWLSPQL